MAEILMEWKVRSGSLDGPIMVTNNEVSVEEAKKLTQQGYKPGDPEWEALGIAKYVTWPRSVCSIEGKDINGNPLKGEYITLSGKKINMSDGFTANVKYFKCDWTPRKPEDYLLSNALCHFVFIEFSIVIDVAFLKHTISHDFDNGLRIDGKTIASVKTFFFENKRGCGRFTLILIGIE